MEASIGLGSPSAASERNATSTSFRLREPRTRQNSRTPKSRYRSTLPASARVTSTSTTRSGPVRSTKASAAAMPSSKAAQ